MPTPFVKTIKNVVKHWYLPLIIGILFLAVGVYTFTSPLETYLTLAILFSISYIFSGLSDIIFAFANRQELENWGWALAMGIVTFLVGILLYIHPEITMITLPFLVGFVMLFRSVSGIGFALDLKNYGGSSWGYLLTLGILGTFFSFFLLFNPLAAGMTLVVCTGLALLTIGVFHIFLALKLRKLKGKISELGNR